MGVLVIAAEAVLLQLVEEVCEALGEHDCAEALADGEDVCEGVIDALLVPVGGVDVGLELGALVRVPSRMAPSARRAGGTSLPTGTATCHNARVRTPARKALLGRTMVALLNMKQLAPTGQGVKE